MASFSDDKAFRLTLHRARLDLVRHNSAVSLIVRLNAAFVASIAILIGVRLYVRVRIVRRFGSDDILMIFAALFTVALSATCIVGTRFGLGRHEWDLDPATVISSSMEIVKTLFVCEVLYATAVTTTKASIIASYIRVLPIPVFRRLMYITASVILALWVCSVCVTIFQCDPIRGAWDFELQDKKCLDLVLCTSPLPLLWKLHIPQQERLMLCMLFGCGLFATVASAIRLSELHNLGSEDFSYACVSSLNWSVVEVGTGIICASVPSMKPILTRLSPRRYFSLTRGICRRNPSVAPEVTLEIERNKSGFETSSQKREWSGSEETGLEFSTQVAKSISTVSNNRMGFGEESLVPAGLKQKLSRGNAE